MDEIEKLFVSAIERSLDAGFEVIELHMAHGYLLHEFLSPLSNHRKDEYGGSLENRMRFPLRIARAARKVWPARLPLFVRISASDWTDGSWTIDDSVKFARELKACGVDLIDCSSGGNVAHVRIPLKPGYQVPFAHAVREQAGIMTGAVGLITEAKQADEILKKGEADAIFIARAFLQNPHWPLFAAHELGAEIKWPLQYERGKFPAGR
jgi:2,4-dienoyl-CoA reductase-like NADH-dependent reductase (Old Yellow Enzyme family)